MLESIFYLGSILVANVLVNQFGIIHFLGLTFPAGAVAIGLTFSARDLVQRKYGKWKCWVWMIVASVITIVFNPKLALASMSAFLISEGVDWLIFTFYRSSIKKRVLLSNLFGTPLDSFVFVTLAFGFIWEAIWGQAIVKLLSSFLVIPFLSKK